MSSSSGIRHHGRAYALQILYAADGDSEVDLGSAAATWHTELELPLSSEAQDFARQLLDQAALRRDKLDELIAASSKNWRLERMSRVDRNILRLGTCELSAFAEVPVRVAINEAVELAKRFGTSDSPAFVNGILDRIAAALGRAPDS
ncbi:MAG TPA: transcription antitermination factor NusB [Kofleriaceae bacterium]|nr:transcription antitermination factor NusB [Kofleriaceae bacterium]